MILNLELKVGLRFAKNITINCKWYLGTEFSRKIVQLVFFFAECVNETNFCSHYINKILHNSQIIRLILFFTYHIDINLSYRISFNKMYQKWKGIFGTVVEFIDTKIAYNWCYCDIDGNDLPPFYLAAIAIQEEPYTFICQPFWCVHLLIGLIRLMNK